MLKLSLVVLVFVALGSAALAQPTAIASPVGTQENAVAQTRVLLASVTEAMDRQRAELETAMGQAALRAKWSDQDRAKALRTILQSATNLTFEQRIAILTKELRTMLQALNKNEISGEQANRQFIVRVRELVGQLGSVYDQQSVYLTRQLRSVGAGEAWRRSPTAPEPVKS